MEIFADTLAGQVSIVTSGGDGNQGQDGSSGRKGADNSAKVWKMLTSIARILLIQFVI